MQIIKYQYLKNNIYKIFFEDKTINLYEDVIIKYNLLIKKELTNNEIKSLLKENEYYEKYYQAIKFITKKTRSEKEITIFLEENGTKREELVEIINKLKKQGYINEHSFAKYYINNEINLKKTGPLKIINDLEKLGIERDIIDQEIIAFSNEIIEIKIKKYIEKQKKANNNKSLLMLKSKILYNLLLLGYNREDILLYLNDIQINEQAIYDQEYLKLYHKLSKKYQGYELERKIKQKLYQKGLTK